MTPRRLVLGIRGTGGYVAVGDTWHLGYAAVKKLRHRGIRGTGEYVALWNTQHCGIGALWNTWQWGIRDWGRYVTVGVYVTIGDTWH